MLSLTHTQVQTMKERARSQCTRQSWRIKMTTTKFTFGRTITHTDGVVESTISSRANNDDNTGAKGSTYYRFQSV